MTEKSSLQEPFRESGVWWNPLMGNVYENHSEAAMPKIVDTIVKCCRCPR